MNLSIIIVSWNTKELTLKCIGSIFKYLQASLFNVFVVDNNSSDGTVAALEDFKDKNKLDSLHIIANRENVGFARANNQVLASLCHSSPQDDIHCCDFILLLNPDTEFIDNKINDAIAFMQSRDDIGILGPKLLNTNGSLQRSCRKFPTLVDQLLIQLKFYNFFPNKFKSIREYFMLDFDHSTGREVDQVMGAAMLIKKEVISAIGGLDENFWAIFEEVDFCQRAAEAGYKTYFYPTWKIYHHKEQSFKQWTSMRKQINFNRSLYHYFKKHKPFWQLFILWFFQPLNLFLTWFDSKIGVRKRVGKSKDL